MGVELIPTFSDVKIEKVTVQYRLHTASHDGNQVKETFKVEAVDPVDDVESPVSSKGKEIMTGDGLCLPGLADHEELWQDGNRLQVDGECPQDLMEGK